MCPFNPRIFRIFHISYSYTNIVIPMASNVQAYEYNIYTRLNKPFLLFTISVISSFDLLIFCYIGTFNHSMCYVEFWIAPIYCINLDFSFIWLVMELMLHFLAFLDTQLLQRPVFMSSQALNCSYHLHSGWCTQFIIAACASANSRVDYITSLISNVHRNYIDYLYTRYIITYPVNLGY